MTGGRPIAEKYLQPMTEVKNGQNFHCLVVTPHKTRF